MKKLLKILLLIIALPFALVGGAIVGVFVFLATIVEVVSSIACDILEIY